MRPLTGIILLASLLIARTTYVSAEDRSLTKVEIGRLGKIATALVEVQKGHGSAFCIHASGFFVTNEHVIRGESKVTLVLKSGEKDQKILTARVLRSDRDQDLALLQAEEVKDLPVLGLGSSDDLQELEELIACGFPFGKALSADKKEYPAVSINTGSVTALRKKDGELHRIQLDGALNPGNSGGPVLDRNGKVVGVVVAGVQGAGVNFAIPVNQVRRLIESPEVEFTPPALTRANVHKSVNIEAKAFSLLPGAAAIELELVFRREGKEQHHKLEPAGAVYRASIVPVKPPEGPQPLRIHVRFADKTVTGTIAEKAIKLAGKDGKLSDIRSVEFGPKLRVSLADGTTVGSMAGLDSLAIEQGKETVKVDLRSALAMQIEPGAPIAPIDWTLIAKQNGKETKRVNGTLIVPDPIVPGIGGTIQPPPLDKDQIVVELSSQVADVAVGGRGRFLVLHLPKESKLAIFDANHAKIVRTLAVPDETLKIAAGMDKLMIVLCKQQAVERWSLATMTREATAPLVLKVPIDAVALGAASQGPMLVEGVDWPRLGECAFFDIQQMKRMELGFNPHDFFPTRPGMFARASGDGKRFVSMSHSGVHTCVWTGKEFQKQAANIGSFPVLGQDGKIIYTMRGMYDEQFKAMPGPRGHCLPAHHGNLFMSLAPERKEVAIYRVGEAQSLKVVGDIGGFEARDPLPVDRRIHLIPEAKLLVTIPATNDKLMVHRLQLQQ